jgi:hypothetical protein
MLVLKIVSPSQLDENSLSGEGNIEILPAGSAVEKALFA